MESPSNSWASSVRNLRKQLNLSQEKLAALLETNQCTISRWERGITIPTYRMRARLMELGCQNPDSLRHDLSAIAAFAQALFDASTAPSMLLHRDGTVMAISSDHEYRPGLKYIPGVKLFEQGPPEEIEDARKLYQFFDKSGFWDTVNACFEYPYETCGETKCVILISVEFNGETFCLMRRKADLCTPEP